MGQELIKLDSVTAGYGNSVILRDVNLSVRKGDFIAVTGPNGGGKTTLFRTILGLSDLKDGTVQVLGSPPSKGCRNIGYVPQFGVFDRDYPILAEEVVRMGLRSKGYRNLWGRNPPEQMEKVMELTGVSGFRGKRIGELSGGQMQRTLIARALVSEPEVILLDEPTASLDPKIRAEILNLLYDVFKKGMTVMVITHDMGAMDYKPTRIIRVDHGLTELCAKCDNCDGEGVY